MTAGTLQWPDIISALLAGRDLTEEESAWAMREILSDRAEETHIAAFLVGLRAKGESPEEINSLANVALGNAVSCDIPGEKLDIVGTGGDGHNTVNISTMSAIVASAAGATVVKHGNRAVSSASGSADLLETLGVFLELPAHEVARSAEEVGLTYCFAKTFHPSFRHVAKVREALGIPTIFNVLGPLVNPFKATAYAIGVSRYQLLDQFSEVLALRGSRALVFMGDSGIDELCAFRKNHVREVRDGKINRCILTAADLNLREISLKDLESAGPQENAEAARKVLAKIWDAADERLRSIQETVLLNAAAGLVAYDTGETYAAKPLAERLQDKMSLAREAIDSGTAAVKLRQWVAFSAAAKKALQETST